MAVEQHATVVGAGIIGVTCAIYLQRAGYRVTLLDGRPPGTACSYGNAGIIAPGACIPLAMPGIWRQIPGYLLDPLGPLSIRWQDGFRHFPWLMAWLRSSSVERVRSISVAMRALHRSSLTEFKSLLDDVGAPELLSRVGQLYVSAKPDGAKGTPLATELRRQAGVETRLLLGEEVRELEPALATTIVSGLYFPDNGHTTNPHRLVTHLANSVVQRGGEIVPLNATGFQVEGDKVTAVSSEKGAIPSGLVVIAAGSWSHRLAAMLGTKVPLVAERGYHMMLPDPSGAPRVPLINLDHGYAVTPMEEGLRISGTVEIADVDAPADSRRATKLLALGKAMLPSIQGDGATTWMGARPSLPDGLPVIDRSPHFPNVLFAFGHSHYGVTGCAVTGRLVGELAAGQPTFIDQRPYALRKF
ncbi:MAG: NAD(P)/FAD-dependent oxidoreductase [Reyranellaceae bacterium]